MKTRNRHLTAALTLTAALLLSGCATATGTPELSAEAKAAAKAMNGLTKDLRKNEVVVYEPKGPWSFDNGYAFLVGGPNEDYATFGSKAANGYWAYLLIKKDGRWQLSTTAPAVQLAEPARHPHRAICLALSGKLGKDTTPCKAITN